MTHCAACLSSAAGCAEHAIPAAPGDGPLLMRQVVALFASGIPIARIATEHALDPWQIEHRLRTWVAERLADDAPPEPSTEADVEHAPEHAREIVREFLDGADVESIAEDHDLASWRVQHRIRRWARGRT